MAKVDENKHKYASAVIVCSHYGDPRDRSNGARPNQFVLPCGCKWGFRVAVDANTKSCNYNKIVIVWCVLEHQNHPISEELIKEYRVKEYDIFILYLISYFKVIVCFVFGHRNCPTEALAYAEKALEAGAVPGRIRKQLEVQFDANVNSKFLQNLKQKIIGMLFGVTALEKLLMKRSTNL